MRKRFEFVLGPHATEENINYCFEPYITLIERYAQLVDESREQINGLTCDIESLNMEIGMLG